MITVTLLVQRLSTKPLLDALNLLKNDPIHTEYLELLAQRSALTQVLSYLQHPEQQAIFSSQAHQRELEAVKARLEQVNETLNNLQTTHPPIKAFICQQYRKK
ncbi:hypothetical protein C8255_20860 [filamentous cyanobacterium CCP3]|nr:hypothetical protein C8255_20860 [filamentous cyanobacterium CCP3]